MQLDAAVIRARSGSRRAGSRWACRSSGRTPAPSRRPRPCWRRTGSAWIWSIGTSPGCRPRTPGRRSPSASPASTSAMRFGRRRRPCWCSCGRTALSGQLRRAASSRFSVPTALVSKSSNGIAAARSWDGCAAAWTISVGLQRRRPARARPARSRMSSSWCWKPGSSRSSRCWFQRVSPCGPKNTARWLLSTPWTSYPWLCEVAADFAADQAGGAGDENAVVDCHRLYARGIAAHRCEQRDILM